MNEQAEQSIFEDLSSLEQTLSKDRTGERAKAMISYFADVAKESTTLQQAMTTIDERQMLKQLTEAFDASQRVIAKAWEALHGTPLVV